MNKMLFSLIKYLQPTHYFNFRRTDDTFVFRDPESIDAKVLKRFEFDGRYKSRKAGIYDLSWQLLQCGYMANTGGLSQFEQLPLVDEYVFVRKYFHRLSVLYVLFIRLLGLVNPFREIQAFWNTRKVKKTDLKSKRIDYDLGDFDSQLLNSQPRISVIIPTLNRYDYLKDVLHDLERQVYSNFEVIVVDQSRPFQKLFYNGFKLDLTLIKQEERALWLARNKAVRTSTADFLLFFDDDSRVEPNWIVNHLRCLDYFNADLSSGVSISRIGAEVPAHYAHYKISDQLDTGNVMIRRSVFKRIGLFDRQFEKQRMGDGEFGMRAYMAGLLNVSNPDAKRLHLKVESGGLREMGSWDAFRTSRWFSSRPIPSVLYFYRRYFGAEQAKLALLRFVPLSVIPYRFKKNRGLKVIGACLSLLLLPVILIQVGKSWIKSSKMIDDGPLIETLK